MVLRKLAGGVYWTEDSDGLPTALATTLDDGPWPSRDGPIRGWCGVGRPLWPPNSSTRSRGHNHNLTLAVPNAGPAGPLHSR